MTDGLSYGEIADRMHVDERTAKRYVQRGKASIEGHI
jgi:DNA-directed RNA polymerase specialized sigma24 family protein